MSNENERKSGMLPRAQDLTVKNLQELYYILPIENLESVLKHGFLSHNLVQKLDGHHQDISNHLVQQLREHKLVPRAKEGKQQLTVHDHVNFYLNFHNAMLACKSRPGVCVVRVRKEVFRRGDGIISDKNAACRDVRFYKASEWVAPKERASHLSSPRRYRSDFTPSQNDMRKKIRQSEALFPHQVSAEFIGGTFVRDTVDAFCVADILKSAKREDIEVKIHSDLTIKSQKDAPLTDFSRLSSLEKEFDLSCPVSPVRSQPKPPVASQAVPKRSLSSMFASACSQPSSDSAGSFERTFTVSSVDCVSDSVPDSLESLEMLRAHPREHDQDERNNASASELVASTGRQPRELDQGENNNASGPESDSTGRYPREHDRDERNNASAPSAASAGKLDSFVRRGDTSYNPFTAESRKTVAEQAAAAGTKRSCVAPKTVKRRQKAKAPVQSTTLFNFGVKAASDKASDTAARAPLSSLNSQS